MKKKVIAFIEDDTADGGLGMVFRSLAFFFAERSDVYYISTRMNNGRIPECIHYVKFSETGEFAPHTNGIKRSLSGVKTLREKLREINPDIAISFGFYSNIRLCLACVGLQCRVLISERGNATRFKGLNRGIVSVLLKRANCIVFQSKAAQNAYPTSLSRKGIVISNAIFKDDLPDLAEEKWEKRIVTVGRIHPDKNFSLLITAFAKVTQQLSDYCLEIYGEEEPGSPEPYLKQLEEQAIQLGIRDKICFMGQSHNIGQALSGARVFVLSSVLEGMPNALIEAMACGLPCITTDFLPGCANEIIENNINGCIVPNCDADALSTKICEVISDELWSRKMAQNAKAIRIKLSKDRIFNKWENTVNRLLLRL